MDLVEGATKETAWNMTLNLEGKIHGFEVGEIKL